MPASYFCQSCAFALKNNSVLSVLAIGRPSILLTWNMQWHDLYQKISFNTYGSTMTYFCPSHSINLGCFLIKTCAVITPIQWLFSLSQVQYSAAWTLELWIKFLLCALMYVWIFSLSLLWASTFLGGPTRCLQTSSYTQKSVCLGLCWPVVPQWYGYWQAGP
jgi:hypothetical protein